jgi:diacylglycerol kinase (ATP)
LSGRYLLIHNPISGGSKRDFLSLFEPRKDQFPEFDIISTTHVGHAAEIVKDKFHAYDYFIAVGGDGTINEIASQLQGTDKTLGIIPIGSANGLAHHLKLPLDPEKALDQIQHQRSKQIDVISADDRIFVNVSGVGFDGHINNLFNETTSRGLWSYAKLIFQEFLNFKEFDFELKIDNQDVIGKAFIIVLANTTQYGHNFHVAPNASTTDGLLHVMVIRKPKFYLVPYLLYTVFKGKILRSKYCSEFKGAIIDLKVTKQAIHFDGETLDHLIDGHINVQVKPKALNVLV